MIFAHCGGGVWLPPENDDVIYEQPLSDMVMLPIEIVSAPDLFLFGARERYDIWKFETEKLMGGG